MRRSLNASRPLAPSVRSASPTAATVARQPAPRRLRGRLPSALPASPPPGERWPPAGGRSAPGDVRHSNLIESRGQCRVLALAMAGRFGLCRRSVPDDLEKPSVVEPVDPLERCELHRLQTSPGPSRANHLRLVQPDHRLGQGVIERIASDVAPRSACPQSLPHSPHRARGIRRRLDIVLFVTVRLPGIASPCER